MIQIQMKITFVSGHILANSLIVLTIALIVLLSQNMVQYAGE